jgi:hypothetical protein
MLSSTTSSSKIVGIDGLSRRSIKRLDPPGWESELFEHLGRWRISLPARLAEFSHQAAVEHSSNSGRELRRWNFQHQDAQQRFGRFLGPNAGDHEPILLHLLAQDLHGFRIDQISTDDHVGIGPHELGKDRRGRFVLKRVIGRDRDVLDLEFRLGDVLHRDKVTHVAVG